MFKSFFLAFIFFLASATIVNAQVVINEVLANPSGEESGAEWVELYNTGQEVASLSGCILYLDDGDTQKVVFGNEDFVDKFKVISWDGTKLNNGGDIVRLQCTSSQDSIAYGNYSGAVVVAPGDGVTFGRNPDGTGSFYILSAVTLGSVNASPATPTPTATPSSTATPTPTPTPTPTHTATPKPSPTKTLTPKATASTTPLAQNNQNSDQSVLGLRENLSPSPTPQGDEGGKKFPFLALGFVLIGGSFMAFAGYSFFKQRRTGYTGE